MRKFNLLAAIAVMVFTFIILSCSKEDNKDPDNQTGSVTDIDGNVYETVKIGSKIWMTSNLKTLRFQNGDSIPTTTNLNEDVSSEETPIYQWVYNGNNSLLNPHGRLYTIVAVLDNRGLCPEGWRIPSYDDAIELFNIVNSNSDKLKSINGWDPSTQEVINADNSTGFSAVASGERYANGTFDNFGLNGKWWTNTYSSSSLSYYTIFLNANYANTAFSGGYAGDGHSCRCLKDI